MRWIALLLLCAQDATFDSDELLKAPSGLAGAFSVAKAPPKVEIVLFKDLPAGKQTLWSSWGNCCLATSGKYYVSIGNHGGIDATSHVYEFDPASKTAKKILDVAQAIGQKPGVYGHGKIHAQIHEAPDECLYVTTYWGKPRELEAAYAEGTYRGSILLKLDPKSGAVENLGAIAPGRGLPASLFDPERMLLYFHSVSKAEDDAAELLVYDLKARAVKFTGGGDVIEGNRCFILDAKGRVYFSAKDGTLHVYDPATNALAATKAKLPEQASGRRGSELRAATRPARSGVAYGMTAAGRLFSFDPAAETVKDLGPNFGDGDYTAWMVLSPDDRFVYFAPGAHGSSGREGTPIVQVDVATGARKVIAFLNEPLRAKLKYNIGGTYSLAIDPAGETLYAVFNGAPLSGGRKEEAFGQPCVAVVRIPKGER